MATNKKRVKTGLPPGSIIYTGSKNTTDVKVHYLKYNSRTLEGKDYEDFEDVVFTSSKDTIIDWYDVRGLHDVALIEQIGDFFDIHDISLEVIVDVNQRPKLEEFDDGILFIIKALDFNPSDCSLVTEQIGIYLKKGLVITFQETESDLFQLVRKRITTSRGKIRAKGADYLAYALMDNIVDHYFVMADKIEASIDKIEEQLLTDLSSSLKGDIHSHKNVLIQTRKLLAPLRESISRFSKLDNDLLADSTVMYIRDLHDHTIQVIDMVETHRDILNGLQDLYLSEISFKMNQVMQVLAVITTIFVPLSFLAGLYGMNFEYIPELKYKYGYFVLLSVFVLISAGSIYYFKKKKWF